MCLTTTDADAITLMTSYGATLLSTQSTFLVWYWTAVVQDDLAELQASAYCLSFVAI